MAGYRPWVPGEMAQHRKNIAEGKYKTYARTPEEAYPIDPNDSELEFKESSSRVHAPMYGKHKHFPPISFAEREEVLHTDNMDDRLKECLNGLNLTVGKKYKILAEHTVDIKHDAHLPSLRLNIYYPQSVYKICNDVGKEIWVRSFYFRPEVKGVIVNQSYVSEDNCLRDVHRIGNYDVTKEMRADDELKLNYSFSQDDQQEYIGTNQPEVDELMAKNDAHCWPRDQIRAAKLKKQELRQKAKDEEKSQRT